MGRFNSEDPKLTEVKAILARLQNMSADWSASEPGVEPDGRVRLSTKPLAFVKDLSTLPGPAVLEPGEPIELAPQSAISLRASGRARALAMILGALVSTTLIAVATRSSWMPEQRYRSSAKSAPETNAAGPSAASPSIAAPAPEAPPAPAPTSASIATPEPTPAGPSVAESREPARPGDHSAALKLADGLIGAGQIAAGRAELLRMAPESSADAAWSLARSYDPNFIGLIANADAPADVDEATKWYRTWHALAVRQGLVADSVSIERIVASMR